MFNQSRNLFVRKTTEYIRIWTEVGWKNFKDKACTGLVVWQVQDQPWQQETQNKSWLEGTWTGQTWAMKQIVPKKQNWWVPWGTTPVSDSYPHPDLAHGLAFPGLVSLTWQRLLRLIYFQGHFSLIIIHMGTIDINKGDPEVTTSSEHLSKEPGHPDRAPTHPMVKEKILVRSKSFLKMNKVSRSN